MSEATAPYLPHTRGHKVLESKPTAPIAKIFPPDFSKPHRISTGDSWGSVASEYGLDVWNLIEFNFSAVVLAPSFEKKCRQVNWLMRKHVGCQHTRDGKNYCFTSKDSPGKIYVPENAKKKGGSGGGGGSGGEITLPDNKRDRQDEIIRLLKEKGFSKEEASRIAKGVMGFKPHHAGTVLARILALGGGLVGATATVVSQFAFVYGFLISLDEATDVGIRNTFRIGFAYGLTAWAFDRPRPKFSENLKTNLKGYGVLGKHIGEHYQAWNDAVAKVQTEAPKAARKCKIDGKHISQDLYRLLLQDYGDYRPGRFSYKFCWKLASGLKTNEHDRLIESITDEKGVHYKHACQYPF